MERLRNRTFQMKLGLYIFFFLLNVALIWFLGIPRIGSVEELSLQHEAELLKVELMLANERTIEEKTLEIAQMEKQINGFDERVPDHIDTPQVVFDFYSYSMDNQVIPTYLSFSEPLLLETAPPPVEGASTEAPAKKNDELISTISLNFSARGKHEDMMGFLDGLEGISDLELTVENVDMHNTEDGLLEVVINFKQYVRGLGASEQYYTEYAFYEDNIGFDDLTSLFRTQSSAVNQPAIQDAGQSEAP